MAIFLGKHAGFCWGVQRAIKLVEDTRLAHPHQPIYTLGDLVHNHKVIQQLKSMDVHAIQEDDIDRVEADAVVIIRSHGVPPSTTERLRQKGLTSVDATCSFVTKAQKIAAEHNRAGYQVILVGDANHSEIVGIQGYAQNEAIVVSDEEGLLRLPLESLAHKKICIVAQTTQKLSFFDQVVDYIQSRHPHTVVHNTICGTTEQRQEELLKMATHMDVMLILGSAHSANTQRLLDISKSLCVHSYLVESMEDVYAISLHDSNHVGITAGASTPHWFIESVVQYLEELKKEPYIPYV